MPRGRILFRVFLVCFASYACSCTSTFVLACIEVVALVSGVEVLVRYKDYDSKCSVGKKEKSLVVTSRCLAPKRIDWR
jgi:general stress protein CsbA